MEEIPSNHLRFKKTLYLSTGAGFLPSTVAPEKSMVGILFRFPFWGSYFHGLAVSFREGNPWEKHLFFWGRFPTLKGARTSPGPQHMAPFQHMAPLTTVWRIVPPELRIQFLLLFLAQPPAGVPATNESCDDFWWWRENDDDYQVFFWVVSCVFFFSFGGRSCAKILGKVQKRPPTLSHYKSAIQKARQKGALWLRAHVVDGQLSHKKFPGVPYFPLNPGCFFSGSLYWLTYYNLHINGYIMDSMIPYIPSIYPKQSVFFSFLPKFAICARRQDAVAWEHC